MTEDDKEVYHKGVAYLEEWEDVNYCEHSFKFKDEWLTDKEVVDLLNDLHKENSELTLENKTQKIDLLKKDIEIMDIKNTIKTSMENERTHIGYNVLKQLWEAIQ